MAALMAGIAIGLGLGALPMPDWWPPLWFEILVAGSGAVAFAIAEKIDAARRIRNAPKS